ncbi:MAG: hypothetical protein K1X92_15195 [Bacteroidia bacterium]|nr:hypothetical protein [Bacteroidia bacterium]
MKRIILPEEKLNTLADLLCDRLYEGRYFSNGVIKGEELKDCTDFPQINKFILFQLFQVLNQQFQKLKHPYFDYENGEVQGSVNQLKNQLSRNIRISREDFKPLLKKAVYNNLKLLLDPVDTLGNFFFHNQEKVSLETYEKYAPFFTDFDFAVNSILRYHQKNGMQTVEKDIFFVKLHRVVAIFNSSSDKDIESYRNDLIMRLTGRTMDDLVYEAQSEAEFKKQEWLRHEEEARRKEEEKQQALLRQQEEELRNKQAEEERLKREEEEKQRAEEERIRMEAEKLRLEEDEKRRKEQSFFDTLEAKPTFFDINDEGDTTIKLDKDEIIEIGTDVPAFSKAPLTDLSPENVIEPVSEITEIDLSLDTPLPDVPEIEVPSVEIPSVDVPEIEVPSVDVPEIEVPSVEVPSVDVPEIEVPSVEVPSVDVPEIEVPSVEIPSVDVPEIEVPSVEIPSVDVPEIEVPSVDLPKPELPDIETTESDTPAVVTHETVIHEEPETPVSDEPVLPFFEKYFKKVQPEVAAEVNDNQSVLEKVQQKIEEPKSVIETFVSDTPSHLINTINAEQKIKLDSIPIHKQYMFVQRVFMGNNVRFRIIIDKVNNAHSREEIEEIVDKYILSNTELKSNDSVVEEFIQLLRSRFVL